jgi:hypothetical protein
MLQQSDIQGRLRLFRYGLVVIVIVSFVVVAFSASILTGFLDTGQVLLLSLVTALVTGAVMAVVYFIYKMILERSAK